jgi:hypothetical protein
MSFPEEADSPSMSRGAGRLPELLGNGRVNLNVAGVAESLC